MPDGAGGYYIGGRIYGAQSTLRLGVAHLLPDGTLDQTFAATITHGDRLPIVRALALSGGVDIVTLDWTPPVGSTVVDYILEVGSSAASPTDLLVQPVGPTPRLVAPAPPGRYFVRVRARNAAGVGPPSGQVVVEVP